MPSHWAVVFPGAWSDQQNTELMLMILIVHCAQSLGHVQVSGAEGTTVLSADRAHDARWSLATRWDGQRLMLVMLGLAAGHTVGRAAADAHDVRRRPATRWQGRRLMLMMLGVGRPSRCQRLMLMMLGGRRPGRMFGGGRPHGGTGSG